jgi:hypothetical protein
MSVIVTLKNHEVTSAALVGFRRQLNATLRQGRPAFPERYPGQLWYNHIAAACAECAVAKYLNVYWDFSVDTFNTTDLPRLNCEIRFSPAGKPKVKPRDNRPIIAVIGNAERIERYEILGWLPAEEAKRDEWASHDDPPCWFPPPNAWNHIDSLVISHADA